MIFYVDECVGCSGMGLPCLGSSCPNRNAIHYKCDGCGDEDVPLYEYDDGSQLCEGCIISNYTRINPYV